MSGNYGQMSPRDRLMQELAHWVMAAKNTTSQEVQARAEREAERVMSRLKALTRKEGKP